jgi:hypothetical protein
MKIFCCIKDSLKKAQVKWKKDGYPILEKASANVGDPCCIWRFIKLLPGNDLERVTKHRRQKQQSKDVSTVTATFASWMIYCVHSEKGASSPASQKDRSQIVFR